MSSATMYVISCWVKLILCMCVHAQTLVHAYVHVCECVRVCACECIRELAMSDLREFPALTLKLLIFIQIHRMYNVMRVLLIR